MTCSQVCLFHIHRFKQDTTTQDCLNQMIQPEVEETKTLSTESRRHKSQYMHTLTSTQNNSPPQV